MAIKNRHCCLGIVPHIDINESKQKKLGIFPSFFILPKGIGRRLR